MLEDSLSSLALKVVFSFCVLVFTQLLLVFTLKYHQKSPPYRSVPSGVGKVTSGHANRLRYLARVVYSVDCGNMHNKASFSGLQMPTQ